MVENGELELVQHFLAKKRAHVAHILPNAFSDVAIVEVDSFNRPTEEDSLFLVMNEHLKFLAPYRAIWPDAIAVLLGPLQIVNTIPQLLDLANDFSVAAGSTHSRLDWYTDRVKLLTIYCSAGTDILYTVYICNRRLLMISDL